MKSIASIVFGFVILTAMGWGVYWLVIEIWSQIKLLDPEVSVGIFTAATTIIVATLTVVVGKQIERKKDIEAHYREKKTEIYDEFLCEFFKFFNLNDEEDVSENSDIVVFLREWQRKMILWGGQSVVLKYIAWMAHLKNGDPDAKTVFLMEDFFLEIRRDLGHKNNRLAKGTFAHLILKNPDLFMAMAKDNPNITLEEVGKAEARLAKAEKA